MGGWDGVCAEYGSLQEGIAVAAVAQFLGFSLTDSPGARQWGARGAVPMARLIPLGAAQLLPFHDVSWGGEAPALVLSVQVLH